MKLLACIGLALMGSTPVLAQDEGWPRDTLVEGPTPYCAGGFSVALREGEVMTVRDPGLDFMLYYIENGDQLLGIYQGNFPDVPDRRTSVRFYDGTELEKFENEDGSWGYLVDVTPENGITLYLHFFGNALQGNDSDKQTFDHFLFGDFGHVFCAGPASNHY